MAAPGDGVTAPVPIKLILRRVRLDSGGYDSLGTYRKGAYFGHGVPLFYYCDLATGDPESIIRARDRDTAKSLIRALLAKNVPGVRVTFYGGGK